MGMDLIGSEGDRHFNLTGWKMLLELALQYGWKPAGLDRSQRERELEEEEDEEEEAGEEAAQEVVLDASEYEVPRDNPLFQALAALLPPLDDPVLGAYFENSGYRITAEDARALADALEQALPDVPDHDALEHKTFTHPAEPGVRLLNIQTPVNPFEWFSGKKDLLRDFIDFCRQGSFEIW
jgi:hypothetical protein